MTGVARVARYLLQVAPDGRIQTVSERPIQTGLQLPSQVLHVIAAAAAARPTSHAALPLHQFRSGWAG
jgi:hypothetical protein